MSKLSELLREREWTPAKPANSANPAREISKISEISRGSGLSCQSTAAATGQASALVTCVTCMHFRERTGESPDGFCRRFDMETWGRVEFSCPGFEPTDEAVRAREARQVRVEAELRVYSAKRVCFEVADVSLSGSPGETVSVMLAVRHGDQILSGEVRIPRERRDLAPFVPTLEGTA